jgi:hypothetical protein
MTTNLNISPYYDDHSTTSGYHQILFKPGLSVQARELTQIQSILRDQIAKFGSHIFKHGSVVIPGNSTSDLTVCFVKLQTTAYDVLSLIGKDITSATSGLRGYIRTAIAAVGAEPATLYISYYNSGSLGEKVFSNNESLTVGGVVTTFTTATTGAVGGAALAFVNRGVFFVNGTFVGVEPQTVILGNTDLPSCHVLLKITESIVNSDIDSTLLDPAQGSYNYAAPGADRLKITLTLVSLPLGSALTEDYVELMRYEEGNLLEHAAYPKYSELEKSLARRTYDESGDYVTSGLTTTAREHLKSGLNDGRYVSPTGDASKFIYTTSAGKAYIRGYENEVISHIETVSDKARTAAHIKTSSIAQTPSYGQYLYVTNILSLPAFITKETLTLYNASAAGVSIGTCRALAIDYQEPNTTDSNAVFKLFITDLVLTGGNDPSDIGNITYASGSCLALSKYNVVPSNSTDFVLNEVVTSSTRVAKVHKFTRSTGELFVYKHTTGDVPVTGDNITATSTAAGRINSVTSLAKNVKDQLIFELPKTSVYRVKNESNVTDLSYKIYQEATVTCVAGAGSFSVTGMTIDPKEQGNFIITSAAGVHPLSVATVAGDGLSVSFAGVSPVGAVLSIVCAATKSGASAAPKSKTLVSAYSQSGLTPSTTVMLNKADGVRLVSVTSTVDGLVTNRFTLNSGQSDYVYGLSFLTLTGTLPTGTLTVVYDYFLHNSGSGDYFSVDSYESSGMADYFSSPLLTYKSTNSGNVLDLRNCLDFRPRIGDNGTFTVGTAVMNKLVQADSRLTTSIRNYVSRYDAITMEKNGAIKVLVGTPSDTPKIPVIPSESLHLASAYVPAWTYAATDIKFSTVNNKVFTMRDIGVIEKRVSNIEDYVTLNATESSIINYDVIDATTGLSRYKSGYLVDTFNNADIIADTMNPQFRVSYYKEEIIPQFEVIETPLVITANTGQVTGNVVTLPYTEVVLAAQPLSSKVTNINPFSVFGWTGSMTLIPTSDTWEDLEYLPTIFNSTSETIVIRIQASNNWMWF